MRQRQIVCCPSRCRIRAVIQIPCSVVPNAAALSLSPSKAMNGYFNIFRISRSVAPVSLTIPPKSRIPLFSVMWQLLVTRPAGQFPHLPGRSHVWSAAAGTGCSSVRSSAGPPLCPPLCPPAIRLGCLRPISLLPATRSLSILSITQQWSDISTGPLSLAFYSRAPDRARVVPNWPRAVPRGFAPYSHR